MDDKPETQMSIKLPKMYGEIYDRSAQCKMAYDKHSDVCPSPKVG